MADHSEYLRKNRDYSRLLDCDEAGAQTPRSQNRGRSKDCKFDKDGDDDLSRERQDYLNRRRTLKELERQKLTKGKNGLYVNGPRDEESKVDHQNEGHGGSCNKGDGGLAPSKGKKKLPYDRSFGSFFGPSEPVVAKRIIEEARAREEAEIVGAREAKASREVERKKFVSSSSAGKSSCSSRPTPGPLKPVDKASEKAQKLKEARDYSVLFEDTSLLNPKVSGRKGLVSSKPDACSERDAWRVTTSVRPTNSPPGKLPLEPRKSNPGARGHDRSWTPLRPLQIQSKTSLSSQPLPNRAPYGHYVSNPPSMRDRSKSSATSLNVKTFSARPGLPDSKEEANHSKEAMMGKLVTGSTKMHGTKISLADGRNSQYVERHHSQGIDRRLAQPADRRPTQATDGRPARSIETRATQVTDRRLVAAQVSERHGVQGLKKRRPAIATHTPAASGAEPRRQGLLAQATQVQRQSLRQKPAQKMALRPLPSDYNRARYRDERQRDDVPRKRARSFSEEQDDLPHRKNKLPDVSVNLIHFVSPMEEDDDSFIDDDNDVGNVSSMIHSIMGYNPNKYRGNDDNFDDRSMEVGFRTIQAEERRSAREARLEDERELALIEAEEKAERLRKAKKKCKQIDR